MDEAVEDGVGEGRVSDDVVPLLDRELAGDEGRADAVPVLEDFEQVVPVLGAERGEPPVVEHEDLGLGERFEQLRITTVGAGDGERGEQPGQPQVEGAVAVTAGAVGERASDPALSDAGQASDILLHIKVNGGQFTTASTHARAPRLRWYAGVVRPIWWSVNRTGPSPVFPSG